MKTSLISSAIVCSAIFIVGCKSNQKDTQAAAPQHSMSASNSPATKPAVANPVMAKSVDHFWFATDDDDPPGRREWVKNADRWEERYEDGHVTKFRVEKMVPEGQYQRPQLRRIADDKFDDQLEVLLPPPVEGGWFEFRRPGETEWHQYKQIHLFPAPTK